MFVYATNFKQNNLLKYLKQSRLVSEILYNTRFTRAISIMIRHSLAKIALLVLVAEIRTHVEIESEDYFFPLEPVINFCRLSEECKHDFVIICGQDTLGIPRLFNDNCDMYEYNCDEKKQYRHVAYSVCNYNLEAQEDDY